MDQFCRAGRGGGDAGGTEEAWTACEGESGDPSKVRVMASRNRHPDTDFKPCSDSRADGEGIVIMTTQVTLSNDVTKVR